MASIDQASLSAAPQIITLSGLQPSGNAFSGSSQGGGFGGAPGYGSVTPGQVAGPDLLQLLLAAQASPGTGGANLTSLLAGLGQTGLGIGNVGQQQGGLVAADTSGTGSFSQPSGTIAGQTGGNTADPAALLAKILGVGSKAVGLASPLMNSSLGTQADIAGSDPAAFAAQRQGERTASPVNDPFQIPQGVFAQAEAAGVTPAELQAFGATGPEIGGGARPGLGQSTTSNTFSQGEIQGGGASISSGFTPGLSDSFSGSNAFGQAAAGLQTGAGLLQLFRSLQGGNAAGAIPGGIQTAQGLFNLLQRSPGLMQSLPQGLQDALGAISGPGLSGGMGGDIGTGLGILGGLLGSKGLQELGTDIGGLSTIAGTVGPMVSALQAGDTAAFEAATAALSAAAPAAAVAAAIQMALTLANDISAGASPLQTTFDTLASPDVIASAIARNVVDPAFQPSAAWRSFPERVEQTAGLEEQGLRALMEGLPYIQSKQELGQELGAFKNLIGMQVGGYGQGSGEFTLPSLPEVGTRTHGMPTPPTPADFGQVQQNTQQIIDLLSQRLPDTGQPFDLIRDFYQFLPRQQFADPNEPWAPRYGDPGFDYAKSGFPMPGQFVGSPNPLWAALGLPSFAPSYQGPQVAAGPAVSLPLPTGQTVLPAPDSPVGSAYASFISQGYTPDQAWQYAWATQPQQGSTP